MMAAPGVPEAMRDAFVASNGPLQRRLLGAMRAAEAAGGDFRGRQSAALLVVEADVRDESWEGVAVDVRVDDDPEPLDRLEHLLDVSEAYEAMRVGTAAAKSGDLAEAGRLVAAGSGAGAARPERDWLGCGAASARRRPTAAAAS